MFTPSRRQLLAASGATIMASATGALANTPTIPAARMVRTNGINLAVREAGSGPAVVLLHGFPGLAFTWRHQIPALAAAGYRVIVPDLRGYGLSDAPTAVEAYDITQLTADLAGMLDALGIQKSVFMGHDWGGLLAWQMSLLRQERVAGVVSVSTPFIPHWMLWLHPDLVRAAQPTMQAFVADPDIDPIAQMRKVYSPNMYVLLFQDGKAADIAMERDPRGTIQNSYRKNLITSAEWDTLPPVVANMEYYGQPLPAKFPGGDVLNADELSFYTDSFGKSGFTPGINWYRNITRNWQMHRGLDQTVRVPSLMVSGENDVVLRPGMTDQMSAHVADLERHVVADSWHWTPEEKPDELNRLVLGWLRKRFPS